MSLSTLGPSRSWASELLLAIDGLFRGWRMLTALGMPGLVLVLTWLAIGVHVHGWVTAFDASTASSIRSVGHRSHGLDEASLITAWLGAPVEVAAAGLIGGALLGLACSFLEAGAVVIGTVAGLQLARTAIGRSFTAHRPSGNPSITAIEYRTSSVSVRARGRDRRAARNHRRVHLGRAEPYCAGPGDGFGGCWRGDRCLQPVVS